MVFLTFMKNMTDNVPGPQLFAMIRFNKVFFSYLLFEQSENFFPAYYDR